MAQSSVVIKVKYGDTLRRFSTLINEDQHLDLDIERLRMKICALFNFTPDADFMLTYTDEDDDQVTLADNEDLYDVVNQGLNPIRISVHFNIDKNAKSSGEEVTGSSTPKDSPSQTSPQNINPRVAEILKSVPEPLYDTLSKVFIELGSKSSTIPNLADVINSLSQVGQSFFNPSPFPSGNSYELNDNHKTASDMENHVASSDEGTKPPVKGARQKFRSPHHPSLSPRKGKEPNSRLFCNMPMGDGIKKDKEIIGDSTTLPTDCRKKDKGIKVENAGSSVSAVDCAKSRVPEQKEATLSKKYAYYEMGTCPFSGVPIPPHNSPVVQRFNKRSNSSSGGSGSIFHTGVRCDGCGVLPITGPRFKSKSKHNYDLCSICFSRMGYDSEYYRIDFPMRYRHPWASKRPSHDPMFGHLPSVQVPSIMKTSGTKHLHSRSDSRFIMDVNVSDGTLMAPSTPFTKIWRMQNNGTLPWARGLQLVWIGGDRFNESDYVEIEIPAEGVNVSNEIDIAVDFIAPELPGRYISYWRMSLPNGHMFGQRVWVLIQVDAALEDSEDDSSPTLKSDIPSPVAFSLPVMDLNLPAGSLDVNVDESIGDDEAEGDLSSPKTTASPKVDPAFDLSVEQHKRRIDMEELNFPINNDLLVASNASITSPFRDATREISIPKEPAGDISTPIATSSIPPSFFSTDIPAAYRMPSQSKFPAIATNFYPNEPTSAASSSVPYPIIDMNEKPIDSPRDFAKNDDHQVSRENDAEETLLKELKEMGFEEVELNKEVLRANRYDLERTVDELCDVEWDPILEELRDMGFEDKETNKKLLMKNNGSLTRVVMDLITEEKQA